MPAATMANREPRTIKLWLRERVIFQKRHRISPPFGLSFTPGMLKVSKEAALLSKKSTFDRVLRLWRALMRSFLLLFIHHPSKRAGLRGFWAAMVNLFTLVLLVLSIGILVKG